MDLGCGDGRLGKELVQKGHEVWGIDVNKIGLQQAFQNGLHILQADLEKPLPFAKESFDVVMLLDTLEHLVDQSQVLQEIGRVLKKEGQLIISYPNHFDLRNRLSMLAGHGIIHWAHRRYATLQAWSYGHLRFLLFKELEKLLQQNGFYPKVVQFNFMAGGIIPRRLTPPFFRRWLLTLWPQLFTGKYIILADRKPGQIKEKIFLAATPPGM